MANKNLEQLRKGDEFLAYARKQGADVRNGHGSHFVVSTEKGSSVVPVHPGEMGKGLRHAIIKQFKIIGLATLLIGIVLKFCL